MDTDGQKNGVVYVGVMEWLWLLMLTLAAMIGVGMTD